LRAFSAVAVALPTLRQSKRVTVEGEVARPGEYVLPPESTLADALAASGGVTASAFVYGTNFTRESVRLKQQENYDRALRDLETDLARATSTQRVATGEESSSLAARSAASSRLVERLRALRPSGRVVLQLTPQSTELPALLLEDGDRLSVPAKPTSIGVFGSVFNSGSYLYLQQRTLGDYLKLAGGPTKGADQDSLFVVRANGDVISQRQVGGGTWANRESGLERLVAEAGDTLFMPEEMDKTTFIQYAKDWTQVLYQFGIGIAGIAALR
jgi:protein involved in polysaccharide export with SLBB domain